MNGASSIFARVERPPESSRCGAKSSVIEILPIGEPIEETFDAAGCPVSP